MATYTQSPEMTGRGSLELSTAEAKVHQIKSDLCIPRRATGLANPDDRSTGFDPIVRLKTTFERPCWLGWSFCRTEPFNDRLRP
ncbi:hypothetical protein [Mesorhizobium sp. 10J20-29]